MRTRIGIVMGMRLGMGIGMKMRLGMGMEMGIHPISIEIKMRMGMGMGIGMGMGMGLVPCPGTAGTPTLPPWFAAIVGVAPSGPTCGGGRCGGRPGRTIRTRQMSERRKKNLRKLFDPES